MDNSTPKWATRAALVVVGWVLAALAALGAVYAALTVDRPGAVLLGVGAVALAAGAAYGTFVRPRLAADTWGLRVRTLGGTRRYDWNEVDIRLVTTRRLGRDVAALELESDHLVVLGWLELGEDPRDVHDALLALRPA
ncbi:PH domain-containing protein [Prauserella cavernicola]|uniref:PH domain-containing protein n=1 Tax=Prauserella cavernicola TaxID=2800127 RepID=A0A934V4W3_9PSEU|nr:PH domain-containing protein [Prauserella cavernicola]MBK1784525.1 PH domain-containing protein [Prauserella cavernicola]